MKDLGFAFLIAIAVWLTVIAILKKIEDDAEDKWIIVAIFGFSAYFLIICAICLISKSFQDFFKVTATFFTSVGVILAALIAYQGATYTVRRKKELDEKHYLAKILLNSSFIFSQMYMCTKRIDELCDLDEKNIDANDIESLTEAIDVLANIIKKFEGFPHDGKQISIYIIRLEVIICYFIDLSKLACKTKRFINFRFENSSDKMINLSLEVVRIFEYLANKKNITDIDHIEWDYIEYYKEEFFIPLKNKIIKKQLEFNKLYQAHKV